MRPCFCTAGTHFAATFRRAARAAVHDACCRQVQSTTIPRAALHYLLTSQHATEDVAGLLAEAACKGDTYLLNGPLGCGKSAFRCVRGAVQIALQSWWPQCIAKSGYPPTQGKNVESGGKDLWELIAATTA